MKKSIERGNAQSQELSRITEQFISRRSVETLENYLPPKTETVHFCSPTAKQREVYVSLLNSRDIKDCFKNDSAQDYLLAITLLKNVYNSPALADTDLTCSFSCELQVLETILRQLRSTDEKVVIVLGYTQTLDLIQNMVIKHTNFPFLRLEMGLQLQVKEKHWSKKNKKVK
jgi:SNF2 family DNA or RNA helicase